MSEKTQKSIEKPWAVYSYIWPMGIGRVESQAWKSVYIRYSEGQLFPLQLWDPHYVTRFDNHTQAIDYFFSRNRDYSKRYLTQKVFEDFPKAIRKESLQQIHDILINYLQQNPHSQSQPKCTKRKSKKLKQLEKIEDIGFPDGYDTI